MAFVLLPGNFLSHSPRIFISYCHCCHFPSETPCFKEIRRWWQHIFSRSARNCCHHSLFFGGNVAAKVYRARKSFIKTQL